MKTIFCPACGSEVNLMVGTSDSTPSPEQARHGRCDGVVMQCKCGRKQTVPVEDVFVIEDDPIAKWQSYTKRGWRAWREQVPYRRVLVWVLRLATVVVVLSGLFFCVIAWPDWFGVIVSAIVTACAAAIPLTLSKLVAGDDEP